jgi:hypothetical protein
MRPSGVNASAVAPPRLVTRASSKPAGSVAASAAAGAARCEKSGSAAREVVAHDSGAMSIRQPTTA